MVLLSIATAAPDCGGGGDGAPPAGCPAGTKPCEGGCIFTSYICCGAGPRGPAICNPVTSSPDVTDGSCLAAPAGRSCAGAVGGADSQFCCNLSSATGTGSTDCPSPKVFCASPRDGAVVCIDGPCVTEPGTPPPTTIGCPSVYDGVYSGVLAYEVGRTHRDASGATIDDPPTQSKLTLTVTLQCLVVNAGVVTLQVTRAGISGNPEAEKFFGCSRDCGATFGSQFTLPATPGPHWPRPVAASSSRTTSCCTSSTRRRASTAGRCPA